MPAADAWVGDSGLTVMQVKSVECRMSLCLRGGPRIVIVDARADVAIAEQACGRIKADSYSAVVPTIALCRAADGDMERCFASGADEVLREKTQVAEPR